MEYGIVNRGELEQMELPELIKKYQDSHYVLYGSRLTREFDESKETLREFILENQLILMMRNKRRKKGGIR